MMSEENRYAELRQKSQQILRGSLKHVRAAALAAALVPLAAVASGHAVAQGFGSGGAAAVPTPCDFVTSGGFVYTDGGPKATFGIHGGCKNGKFWGHLNYVDHTNGYHVNSTEITGYLTPSSGSTIREICGVATTNAAEGLVLFRVRLIDNGEPGVDDQFGISLSNGYSVTTRSLGADLSGGGNIQLHEPNSSTRGPDPAPSETVMCSGLIMQ
jgi:hypothetical protein